MIRRLLIALLCTVATLQVGAAPAAGDSSVRPSLHYLARADQRLCPSPMCGGLWLTAVNTGELRCTDPAGRECYVAATTIGALPLPGARRSHLAASFAEGRALATGQIARGLVEGFPDLGVLQVSQVWITPRASPRARGKFFVLRDGTATVLNTDREIHVSAVDLSRAGATAAERRRARAAIASTTGLIVVGRIVRNGGRRTVAASQLYERAYP